MAREILIVDNRVNSLFEEVAGIVVGNLVGASVVGWVVVGWVVVGSTVVVGGG